MKTTPVCLRRHLAALLETLSDLCPGVKVEHVAWYDGNKFNNCLDITYGTPLESCLNRIDLNTSARLDRRFRGDFHEFLKDLIQERNLGFWQDNASTNSNGDRVFETCLRAVTSDSVEEWHGRSPEPFMATLQAFIACLQQS